MPAGAGPGLPGVAGRRSLPWSLNLNLHSMPVSRIRKPSPGASHHLNGSTHRGHNRAFAGPEEACQRAKRGGLDRPGEVWRSSVMAVVGR